MIRGGGGVIDKDREIGPKPRRGKGLFPAQACVTTVGKRLFLPGGSMSKALFLLVLARAQCTDGYQ